MTAPCADSADHLTVSQWARLQVDIGFVAQVVIPAEDNVLAHRVVVTLRGRDGVYYEGTTDPTGSVTVPHVSPGVYVLTAHGEGTFACYALHLLDESIPDHLIYPDSIEIPLASLPFEPHIDKTVRPLLPPEHDLDHLEITAESLEKIVGHVRGNELHRVRQSSSGSLMGRIYQAGDHGFVLDDEDLVDRLDPSDGTNVFLFRQDERIARDLTSDNGRFELPSVAPGIYSIVAVGPHGVAVLGFELIGSLPDLLPTPVAENETNRQRFVSQISQTDSEFAVQVIPMTIAQWNGEMGMECGCEVAPPSAPAPGGGGAATPPPPLGAAALGAALIPGGGGGFQPVPPASPDTLP